MRHFFLALLVTLSASCAGAHALRRGEPPIVEPNEGLIVLAAEANGRAAIVVCRDAVACVDVGPVDAHEPVSAVVVPEGRYCLVRETLESGGSSQHALDTPLESAACIDIVAGVATYPGHLLFHSDAVGNSAWATSRAGWERRDDDMRKALDAAFPDLARVPLRYAPFIGGQRPHVRD